MLTISQFRKQLRKMVETRTLEEIGAELGVSHATVSRWIHGKRQPSDTVLILAEVVWKKDRVS